MTAALGRWEEFRLHVHAGLSSKDLSEDDIKELLLQAAIYCGVPTANHAIKEARGEIDALAKRKKAARRRPS
jgi:alkylhydroperoxidase/carboxymuconolactone decarboxylase family protein YurZ